MKITRAVVALGTFALPPPCRSAQTEQPSPGSVAGQPAPPALTAVTRANALENDIRLYSVASGQRRQLASFSGRVAAGSWHDYALEASGDHIQVFWDGKKVLDHHDATFAAAGRVGVWTKADSVTYFDDLRVAALGAAP